MIHTFIGDLGHFFVVLSFVSAMVSAYAYFKTSAANIENPSWKKFARIAFFVHSAAVLGIISSLFTIIYQHYYEYHYAWSHSSNNLPSHYMISCFWEGQEGSFLLWIFWHVCLGLILIKTAKIWEANVMLIFTLVQAFLNSMILGIVFFDTFKVGSSPFMLLKDVMTNAPIFSMNPNFIPEDGTGLNPLLQNYWMVIHPPTLFLGFALTLIPFAYCLAGLRKKEYKSWIKPALPWATFGAMVLGIGIMMGAYWAYETLNFGGYWNWDPVENAVYVPWLVLVASIHVMISVQKSNTALKSAMVLNIATFVLILYSTFLTRSGILGEASVHSFTDLGLSGQLLIYLLVFTGIAIFYLVKHWKNIPPDPKEISVYSREFWIFMGATTLCLSAFQVLVPTSLPVFNAIVAVFGEKSNLAPPSDQVEFYTKFQLWFGVLVAVLSGTGQFFWWKRIDKENLIKAMSVPLSLTLLLSAVLIMVFSVSNWKFIILLTVGIYSIISNIFVVAKLLKIKNLRISGGAVAHIGIAMMLLGILASSGYSKVVSLNSTGLLYNREFSDDMNKENLLLFRGKPQKMGNLTLTYKGTRMESVEVPTYLDQENLQNTAIPFRMVTTKDVNANGKTYFTKGDTLTVFHENTYYEIEYQNEEGKKFTLFPRIQNNAQMGFVPSPDISHYLAGDLYTHVTNIPDPEAKTEWKEEPQKQVLHIRDTFYINDYVAILDDVKRGQEIDGEDVNIFAQIRILDRERYYELKPAYLIKENLVRKISDENKELGVKMTFESLDPATKTFTFAVATTQRDWIIMKAIEKPLINILWIGTILMGIGFAMATFRHYAENKQVLK
ncbi:MAG: cytochrome C biogenesis protein [Bacteroidetes bacterium]|nr:MAG: cytochrome C biogenesis protein [Bacteroidota bacterium]